MTDINLPPVETSPWFLCPAFRPEGAYVVDDPNEAPWPQVAWWRRQPGDNPQRPFGFWETRSCSPEIPIISGCPSTEPRVLGRVPWSREQWERYYRLEDVSRTSQALEMAPEVIETCRTNGPWTRTACLDPVIPAPYPVDDGMGEWVRRESDLVKDRGGTLCRQTVIWERKKSHG